MSEKKYNRQVHQPNWVMLVRFGREVTEELQKWTLVVNGTEWADLWQVEDVYEECRPPGRPGEVSTWLRVRCGNDINDIIIGDAVGQQSSDGRIQMWCKKGFQLDFDEIAACYAQVARGHYDGGAINKTEPIYVVKPTLPDTPVSTAEDALSFPLANRIIETEAQFSATATEPEVLISEGRKDYPPQLVGEVWMESLPGMPTDRFLLTVDRRRLIGSWKAIKREIGLKGFVLYAVNNVYTGLCELNERVPFMHGTEIYSEVHLLIPGPIHYSGDANDGAFLEVVLKQ